MAGERTDNDVLATQLRALATYRPVALPDPDSPAIDPDAIVQREPDVRLATSLVTRVWNAAPKGPLPDGFSHIRTVVARALWDDPHPAPITFEFCMDFGAAIGFGVGAAEEQSGVSRPGFYEEHFEMARMFTIAGSEGTAFSPIALDLVTYGSKLSYLWRRREPIGPDELAQNAMAWSSRILAAIDSNWEATAQKNKDELVLDAARIMRDRRVDPPAS